MSIIAKYNFKTLSVSASGTRARVNRDDKLKKSALENILEIQF